MDVRKTFPTLFVLFVVVTAVPFGTITVGASTTSDASPTLTGSDTDITASTSTAAESTTLTILSYNDIQTAAADPGAMGRLVGLLNERRAAHANPTVVVGGGDQVSPSSLSPISQWRVPTKVLNVAEPDAEVIGNHDLDYGFEAVQNFSDASEFPWLAANIVREDGSGIPGTKNYTIVERDGVRVGIVGLVDEAIKPKTAVDFEEHGYRVADFVDVGSRVATKLKTEKDVDVVIAAAHIGVPESKELANHTDNIDVIVTGDDEIAYEPTTVSGTVITEAEARAEYVSEINLTVTGDSVTMVDGRLIPVTENTTVNETARDIVAEARTDQLNQVIGETTVPLDSTFSSNYHDETAWGNFITDAFRNETGAEVAITNAGGIRGNFVMDPGNVTYGDVYTSLPFGNYLVTKRMTGTQLREFLASQVVVLEGSPFGEEASLQVSGVTYEYIPHEGREDVIGDVYVNGEPLDPDENYTVTVNSYMAGWSFEDRYNWSMADLETVGVDYTLYGTVVADYLSARSPISPADTNRIRRVDRPIGTGAVVLQPSVAAKDTVTLRVEAPESVTAVNESGFALYNASDEILEPTSVTLRDDTLVVVFERDAFEATTRHSDEFELYGTYTDAEYDDQFVYFEQAILNVDVHVPSGQMARTSAEDSATVRPSLSNRVAG